MNQNWIKILLVAGTFPLHFANAGTWVDQKYSGENGSRTFRFFIPKNVKEKEMRPLLVGMHGCTQNAEDFAGLTRLEKLAEEKKVYLLLPEQSRLNNLNLCWNWFSADNQDRDKGEPGLVAGMIRWARSHFTIDSSRIYAFGPSAGGGFTSTLLATYPDIFAAGMVGSGTMHMSAHDVISGFKTARHGSDNKPDEQAILGWQNVKKLNINLPKKLPVLVFHGDADKSCHAANSLQVVKQFVKWNDLLDDGKENSSISPDPVSTTEEQVPNGYAYTIRNYGKNESGIVISYYLVHEMGHGWSGGDDNYSFNFSKGPDQTAIMWDFFKKHSK